MMQPEAANPNANGAPVAGIQITGEIKRSDFNLGSGFPAPMISDEVRIKADGEFGKTKQTGIYNRAN